MTRIALGLMFAEWDVTVVFTSEEIERFKTDDEYFRHFRLTLETEINVSVFALESRHSLAVFSVSSVAALLHAERQ